MIIEVSTNYEGEIVLSAFEALNLSEIQNQIEDITGEEVSLESLENLESKAGRIHIVNPYIHRGQPNSWIFRKTSKEEFNKRVLEEAQAKLLK